MVIFDEEVKVLFDSLSIIMIVYDSPTRTKCSPNMIPPQGCILSPHIEGVTKTGQGIEILQARFRWALGITPFSKALKPSASLLTISPQHVLNLFPPLIQMHSPCLWWRQKCSLQAHMVSCGRDINIGGCNDLVVAYTQCQEAFQGKGSESRLFFPLVNRLWVI